MTENHIPEKNFVQEEIREMPVNRRKLAAKLLVSALCGLVFALCASLIFLIAIPAAGRRNQQAENADETEDTEALPETETEESTEEKVVIDYTVTVEDYQRIQNELYAIGRSVNKSVVMITSTGEAADWFNNTYETRDQISGVIISETEEEYRIVTEAEALPEENTVTVTFINEATASGEVRGRDLTTGIAIVAVAKKQLEAATRNAVAVAEAAEAGSIHSGQIAIALGSPLGSCYSILTGSITSTDKELSRTDNNFPILTTDIIGNDAGSGVLINTDGKIIGLITRENSNSEQQNTLTAIQMSEAQKLVEVMQKGSGVPYLGLKLSTVTNAIAYNYSIPRGVYVTETVMDSPAMLGGLQSGDVITQINGRAVDTTSEFYNYLLDCRPGSVCMIRAQRQNGQEYYEVTCTLTVGTLE